MGFVSMFQGRMGEARAVRILQSKAKGKEVEGHAAQEQKIEVKITVTVAVKVCILFRILRYFIMFVLMATRSFIQTP